MYTDRCLIDSITECPYLNILEIIVKDILHVPSPLSLSLSHTQVYKEAIVLIILRWLLVEIEGEAIFADCIAAPFLSADRRLTSLRLLKGQCVVFMYIPFHFISLILSNARIACLNSGKRLTKEQYKRWNSNDIRIKERPQTSRRCRYINADVLSGGSTGRTHCIWRTNMKSQGWLTLSSLFEVISIGHCATKLFSVKPPRKEQYQQCLKNEVDVVCCFHGGLLMANNGPNSATQIVQRGIFLFTC